MTQMKIFFLDMPHKVINLTQYEYGVNYNLSPHCIKKNQVIPYLMLAIFNLVFFFQ